MSIHSKGQNPKTWKPGEEIFVSALELVLASLTLVKTGELMFIITCML